MTTRIILARHGEADYETELLSGSGGTLTPLGRSQARGLGRALSGAGVDAVWSSSLSRAVQTAELAATELGIDLVTVREGLQEYGVGSLAGLPESEFHQLFSIFDRYVAGDDTARIPGGDLVRDWVGRVAAAMGEVASAERDHTVLVVSHGGAILAVVPELCGFPRAREAGHSIDSCAYLVLEHDGADPSSGWRVLPEEIVSLEPSGQPLLPRG